MFEIKTSAKGFPAFIANTGRTQRERAVSAAWSDGLKRSLTNYATGRASVSVKDRFKPSAFAVYGLKSRQGRYQERQRKLNGYVSPYRSPRRKASFDKLAMAVLDVARGQVNGNALAAALKSATSNKPHMADLVTRPGGYRISSTAGGRKIRTKIAWPGARVLNRLGNTGIVYRKQFPDLRLGGNRDANAILREAGRYYTRTMFRVFSSYGLQQVRGVA